MEAIAKWFAGGALVGGSKTVRLALAVVLAFGLVPILAVPQAFAAEPVFVGSVHYETSYDENGFPFYNEDGTFKRDRMYVTIDNIENASGTVEIPASFDLKTKRSDGSEEVVRVENPLNITLGSVVSTEHGGVVSWTNEAVTGIDLSMCTSVANLIVERVSSVTSIDLGNSRNLKNIHFELCNALASFEMGPDVEINSYAVGNCPQLDLPDFSKKQLSGLESLSISGISAMESLDLSMLVNLEDLSIHGTSLSSLDVSSCASLRGLYLDGNKLARLDVSAIPASVTGFSCRYNEIDDTSGLVERFGASSVLPQNEHQDACLKVISEHIAQGTLLAGDVAYFVFGDTFTPAQDEYANFSNEAWDNRFAPDNFHAVSSDSSVVAVSVVDDEDSHPSKKIQVKALQAGTATITVDYRFEGEYGTYEGQQIVDFTVAESVNPIVSISCSPTVDLIYESDCAIDGKSHHSVDNAVFVPIEVKTQYPDRLPTVSANIEVTLSDESVVNAQIVTDPQNMDCDYALRLNPSKPGVSTATITAVTQVAQGEPVQTEPITVQINVSEVEGPTLEIAETYEMIWSHPERGSIQLPIVNPESGRALASYVDNAELREVLAHHPNGFTFGVSVNDVRVVEAVSSNESVAKVTEEGSLNVVGPGTTSVTIKDVWGNSGTCVVTVKDPADEAPKLSLSRDEITVKQGEVFDLSTLVEGMDDLDPMIAKMPLLLAFKTDNGYIAPVTFNNSEQAYICKILGRNVGTVNVSACLSVGRDFNGSLEYLDQWDLVQFGTLTVHVISDDLESNPVTSIKISAPSSEVEMGSVLQLSAAVAPEDADNADELIWTTSDEAVAEVDDAGKVVPIAPGTATITATVGSVSDSFAVTVVAPEPETSIELTAVKTTMIAGDTQKVSATVVPADKIDEIVWSSSDNRVLSVDQGGTVTAVGNGVASVTASIDAVSASTDPITVTTPVSGIGLDSSTLQLFVGGSASALKATVSPSTASNAAVTWTSSDPSVATVDADGTVVPVGAGSATITATSVDGGFEASCAVSVTQPIEGISLDKEAATIIGAKTTTLTATVAPESASDKSVAWSSSNTEVATVDASGTVTAVGKGAAVVTATTADGEYAATCAITVCNPITRVELEKSISLIKGSSTTLEATLAGDLPGELDTPKTLSWWTGNESVASVSGDGPKATVTALKSGLGSVRLVVQTETRVDNDTMLNSLFTRDCVVTVTNPATSISLSDTAVTATVGDDPLALKATVAPVDADGAVAWSSSDTNVATVDANGLVTVKAAGSATITATAGTVSAACKLTVNSRQITAAPQESGFAASVIVSDSETAKVLDQYADEGVNLVVESIVELTQPAKDAIEKLTESGAKVAETFDIRFTKDNGDTIVLGTDKDGKVTLTVKVALSAPMRALLNQGMALKVHYVGPDGTVEEKQTWVEGDSLYFVTEHFSDYVVTGVPQNQEGDELTTTPTTLPKTSGNEGGATDGGKALAATGDASAPLTTGASAFLLVACAALAIAVRKRKASR